MPWWAILYAGFYFLLSAVGDFAMFRRRTSTAYWLCEAVAHFGIGVLLVGYWISAIPSIAGSFGVIFFLLALAWEVITGIRDARETLENEESSTLERVSEVVLPILLIGPAYLAAGLAVFRP